MWSVFVILPGYIYLLYRFLRTCYYLNKELIFLCIHANYLKISLNYQSIWHNLFITTPKTTKQFYAINNKFISIIAALIFSSYLLLLNINRSIAFITSFSLNFTPFHSPHLPLLYLELIWSCRTTESLPRRHIIFSVFLILIRLTNTPKTYVIIIRLIMHNKIATVPKDRTTNLMIANCCFGLS